MPKTNRPSKELMTVRLPPYTIKQIEELSIKFSGKAAVIQAAVDRLYQQELAEKAKIERE
jgi:Arc/MetJ-type ribon-helix-helix transcriptional regulator